MRGVSIPITEGSVLRLVTMQDNWYNGGFVNTSFDCRGMNVLNHLPEVDSAARITYEGFGEMMNLDFNIPNELFEVIHKTLAEYTY